MSHVPIKLYLQNHMVGWAWPVGSDLPTPRLGDRRRQWHPTPVLLPGKSHGWRRLVGCSPWGCEKSDTTEQLHFSLACTGEGNGNPLQCSCLENPRDGRNPRDHCSCESHLVTHRLMALDASGSRGAPHQHHCKDPKIGLQISLQGYSLNLSPSVFWS